MTGYPPLSTPAGSDRSLFSFRDPMVWFATALAVVTAAGFVAALTVLVIAAVTS